MTSRLIWKALPTIFPSVTSHPTSKKERKPPRERPFVSDTSAADDDDTQISGHTLVSQNAKIYK
jgi:hypothetical protein